MCLAAPCSTRPIGKWEQRLNQIVRHPLRLFTLSSALHGATFLLQSTAGVFSDPWSGVLILFTLLSFVFLGYLLEYLPGWTSQPEIQYAHYFVIFLLQFGGLLGLQFGLGGHPTLLIAGGVLVTAGWILGMKSLCWVLQWSSFLHIPALRWLHPALRVLSYAMACAIAASLLNIPPLSWLALIVAAISGTAVLSIALHSQRQSSAH